MVIDRRLPRFGRYIYMPLVLWVRLVAVLWLRLCRGGVCSWGRMSRSGSPNREFGLGLTEAEAATLASHCSRLGCAGAAVVVYEVGGVGLVHRGHPHAVLLPGDQSGDRVRQAGEIGHKRLP